MSIAWSNEQGVATMPVAADYSGKQFYAMKIASAKATLCTVEGETCFGVLQDDPAAAGRAGTVRFNGITPAVAGTGGVTNGDLVTTAADGRLVTTTTADHYVLGQALETASAGERFAMLLVHSRVHS